MFFRKKKKSAPVDVQAANDAANAQSEAAQVRPRPAATPSPPRSEVAPNPSASAQAAQTTEGASQTAPLVVAERDTQQSKQPANADRDRFHRTVGIIVTAMTRLSRYRDMRISDLESLVLAPLARDRLAIATSKSGDAPNEKALTGFAIWANVSPEVDAKIREQIKSGAFPVRLQPNEWNSGTINWLFDVIAPNQKMSTAVIANFSKVVDKTELRLHPVISKLIDPEILKQLAEEKV